MLNAANIANVLHDAAILRGLHSRSIARPECRVTEHLAKRPPHTGWRTAQSSNTLVLAYATTTNIRTKFRTSVSSVMLLSLSSFERVQAKPQPKLVEPRWDRQSQLRGSSATLLSVQKQPRRLTVSAFVRQRRWGKVRIIACNVRVCHVGRWAKFNPYDAAVLT